MAVDRLFTNAQPPGREDCLDLVTVSAARIMRQADYGIAPGCAADLVVLDARDAAEAVCTLAQPLFGVKRGRLSFMRPAPRLAPPEAGERRPLALLA
ncbi:hypothetical protein [Methylobacterium nodulans]|uniref:hypothetical protein n=1 Tax=Methylobacterium nodulans TaxID=114616 RepID=UPI00016171CD